VEAAVAYFRYESSIYPEETIKPTAIVSIDCLYFEI
jgi:hypothetical protein